MVLADEFLRHNSEYGLRFFLRIARLFDSLATMLRNYRRPKGSSTWYIFFYFEDSVNIHNI